MSNRTSCVLLFGLVAVTMTSETEMGFRRLTSNQFFRGDRFHGHCCGTKPAFKSRSALLEKPPQAVNEIRLK
jgi:hypothetical protein